MSFTVRRHRRARANSLVLIATAASMLLATVIPGAIGGATALAATPPPEPSAGGEIGIVPDDRDELLGTGWGHDGDTAHVVLGSADGLEVLTAQSADGYAWRTTAELPLPWADTDLWVSNSCVTSSGDYMAVVYAPRSATNSEEGFAGGADAAIVDLGSGEVTHLGTGYTISYFNPGCGAEDSVTITRYESDFATTRIALIDAPTGEVEHTHDLDGLVTSAVAQANGTILAARGGDILSIAPSASAPQVAVTTEGAAYDLAVDDEGRVAYLTLEEDRETATAYLAGGGDVLTPEAIGSGPVTEIGVRAAQQGGFQLTGSTVDTHLDGVTGVDQIAEADPRSVISSTGALIVDSVKPSGVTEVEPAGAPQSDALVTTSTDPEIAATSRVTGSKITFSLDDTRPSSASETSEAAGLLPVGEASTDGARLRSMPGDPHDPVEAERTCAVPRNDPANQAYQPKPRQVEWAVDRAVKGELTETRPEDWRNLGMEAYSPQSMFKPIPLVGGGTIPPQIVLGVLLQESNLWQASRYTAPGNTGNPLIGDYYGNRPAKSIWDINFSGADCGYGIGQITDGMRLAGHERTDPQTGRPIETALSHDQQRAIALDYTANISMSVRMLAEKWNELANAGMLVNDGRSAHLENWFFAVWAYNSGFHPDKGDGSPWGIGWFNNPINTIYSPSRSPFLQNSQSDAARPQDWPYPEKVIGWAGFGTSLIETQYADSTTRSYVSQRVSSFRTAWWNGDDFRSSAKPPVEKFCSLEVNDCDPSAPQPCQLSTSTDHYFECWWNTSAAWKTVENCDLECGHGFERFPSSYATEASSMPSSLPSLTLRPSHQANCKAPPAGVVVVDDTTHRNARTKGECTHRSTTGSFEFTFAQADPTGSYPAKVDLHQQGGGFNGHFSFAHMQDKEDPQTHITGRWDRGVDMSGTWTRVWVHLPDYAGWTQQAGYTVDLGDGTTQTRYLPQRRYANEWVSVGVFQMKGTPSVSLSNVLVDDDPRGRYGTDIAGLDNIAWDAVGFQALPEKPDDFVVALGDSYGSGEGADDYAPWSDNNGTSITAVNACHQSANAWIRKTTLPGDGATIGAKGDSASPDLDFHFLACSGAETENLLPFHSIGGPRPTNAEGQSGAYGQAGTVSQLDAGYLDENTTLVTMSVGGNDMRFSGIISACVQAVLSLTGDCSEEVLEGDTESVIPASTARMEVELPESLTTVIDLVRERAPNARIAVTGYPKLFESGTQCVAVAEINQDWLNTFADSMNDTIQRTVEAANSPGAPEAFFVDTQEKFTGHNLCTGDGVSGINGLQWTVTPGESPLVPGLGFFTADGFVSRTSVHPNNLGTDLYSQALEDALALRH